MFFNLSASLYISFSLSLCVSLSLSFSLSLSLSHSLSLCLSLSLSHSLSLSTFISLFFSLTLSFSLSFSLSLSLSLSHPVSLSFSPYLLFYSSRPKRSSRAFGRQGRYVHELRRCVMLFLYFVCIPMIIIEKLEEKVMKTIGLNSLINCQQ